MMKKTNFKKVLSLILCTVLLAAMAQIMVGCGKQELGDTITIEDGKTYGEGATSFTLSVTDGDGKEITCTVNTDEKMVGVALSKLGIIVGEEGPYGIYTKVVNGITADYDETGTYWAFYIGGEYAMTGADMTEIVPGETYAFKVES